jgi:hypothetical protein
VKVKHNTNPGWARPSATLSPEYQAEVDATMAKALATAERALAYANRRLERVRRIADKVARAREMRAAVEAVEARRQELLEIQRMMSASPASMIHRGKGRKHAPVPPPVTL